jgi:hypothetical protein
MKISIETGLMAICHWLRSSPEKGNNKSSIVHICEDMSIKVAFTQRFDYN